MSAILAQQITVLQDITKHAAWLGKVSGLKAEKMLRGRKKPYLYVLRAGEFENDYYVTFLHADLTVRHLAFHILITPEGWYYENTGGAGPFLEATIDDVLHAIMHCEKGENTPFINFQQR